MTRAIVFANGKMEHPPEMLHFIRPEDLVIAADGGSLHCKRLGITPNVIIGDLDSLKDQAVFAYANAGIRIVRFSREKDETDLELALQYALKQGILEAYIFGALGARWDMTLANILLLAHPICSNIKLHLLDGNEEMTILRGRGKMEILGHPGDPVSLIPLSGDAQGITTQGLAYPLKAETLYFGSPRGVSNTLINPHALIELEKGVLLCITHWPGTNFA